MTLVSHQCVLVQFGSLLAAKEDSQLSPRSQPQDSGASGHSTLNDAKLVFLSTFLLHAPMVPVRSSSWHVGFIKKENKNDIDPQAPDYQSSPVVTNSQDDRSLSVVLM